MTEFFLSERLPELWLRTGEHIVLAGASTLIAAAIGLPLGIRASRNAASRGIITGAVSLLQTVPSMAMLALLLALLNRIGAVPATIALVLYALLPIVRNTLTGLQSVAPSVLEAADGIGMTSSQRLRLVELPLAMPVIVAGIRTAAVVGVGIATLSAFIGAGGLGQFINRGLSLNNHHLILLGAIPTALLALLVDASIASVQWSLTSRRLHHSPRRILWRSLIVAAPIVILVLGCVPVLRSAFSGQSADQPVVRVGAKRFTEQLILGEIMAQLIELRTPFRVERRFDLGGTLICHQALINGELDVYAEYTGTGLTAILEQPALSDPDVVYRTVVREYAARFDLTWLQPFGFNNTYAITVRADDARNNGWKIISDLIPDSSDLHAGWTFEFSERPDGYPALQQRYGLSFGEVNDLEAGLMYEAIVRRELDVISAFATDGRIAAYDLVPLEDDRGLFPPYYAAPVIRAELLRIHPELGEVLGLLAGRLSNHTMQQLNLQVDQGKQAPAAVARTFLSQLQFDEPHSLEPIP